MPKRTAATALTQDKAAKKRRIDLFVQFRDALGLVQSFLDYHSAVNLAITCQEGLKFMPMVHRVFGEVKKVKPCDLLIMERDDEDFGKVADLTRFKDIKAAVLHFDGFGSAIDKVFEFLPQLESLRVTGSYLMRLGIIPQSIKRLEIASTYMSTEIGPDAVQFIQFHTLEKLGLYTKNRVKVSIYQKDAPKHKKAINKIYGTMNAILYRRVWLKNKSFTPAWSRVELRERRHVDKPLK